MWSRSSPVACSTPDRPDPPSTTNSSAPAKSTVARFTKVKIAGRGDVAADAVGVEVNITAIQNEGREADTFTKVKIAGRGGVADDAVGVEVNITAIQNEGRGFATLYPCTPEPPTASTLNYTPGINIANATTVALNANGEVCIYSNVTAHYALLDVVAYVPAGSDVDDGRAGTLARHPSRPGSPIDGQFLGAGKVRSRHASPRCKIAGRGDVAADRRRRRSQHHRHPERRPRVRHPLPVHRRTCPPRRPSTTHPASTSPTPPPSPSTASGEVCIFSNVTAHYALDVLAYVAG